MSGRDSKQAPPIHKVMKYTFPDGKQSIDITIQDIKDLLEFPIKKIKDLSKKNNKGKIGIIIAISTEEEDEKNRVDNDLVKELNKFLNSKNLIGVFNIIVLNKKEAEKIDSSNWINVVRSHSAHVIVYGHVSKRNKGGIKNYSLKFEAGVVHSPIPVVLSKLLSAEFSSLFPRERFFPVDDDLLGFEITAEWISLAVEYMVGVAFFVSRNLGLAFKIFSDLKEKLDNVSKIKDVEAIEQFKLKVPQRIIEVSLSICDFLYTTYSYKRDKNFIIETKKYLDVINSYNQEETRVKHFASIYYFLIEKDVVKAIQELRQFNDPLQPYNMGFLYFFKDEIEVGLRYYFKALKREVPSKSLIDIESFISDTLDDYPTKLQLYFSRGLINYKGKEDLKLALEDFKKFNSMAKNNPKYVELIRLSAIYVKEIYRSIK